MLRALRLLPALLILPVFGCHAPPPKPPKPPPKEPLLLPPPPAEDLPGEELASWLSSKHPRVRQQAVDLAWKAGPEAVPTAAALLDADEPETARAAERALWTLVHHFSSPRSPRGRRDLCTALCAELEEPHSIAARRILLRILGVAGIGLGDVDAAAVLLDHPELAGSALAVLERIPHRAADEVLLEALDEARSGGAEERTADIVRALGARRSDVAVAPLLELAAAGNPAVAGAARHALARIGAPEAGDFFLELVDLAPTRTAAADALRFAATLVARGHRQCAGGIYQSLSAHPVPHIRAGALHGASAVPCARSLELLLTGLTDDAPAVRAVARDGLIAWSDRSVRLTLANAFRDGSDPLRAQLLRVCVARADHPACSLLADALDSRGEQERLAGLELAAVHGEPMLEPALRQIAEHGTEAERALAERGLLACAHARAAAGDHAVALDAFRELAGKARQPAVVQEAVEGISRTRLALASALADRDPAQAVSLLETVVRETRPGRIRESAARQLRALGVDTAEFARAAGFFTSWQLFGPEAIDVRPFGEHPFAAGGPDPDANPDAWLPVDTDDLDGIVDFLPLFEQTTNQAVYAYLCFDWPYAEPALLKLGSDDGVVVWHNNRLVHRNEVMRGLTIDSDTVPIELAAGRNCLLVKVTQGGGDWRLCLRLTDLKGNPF